jgi:hypothetical protein
MIPPYRFYCRPGLALLSVGLLCGCCLASAAPTNEFRLSMRPLMIPERGTVTSYVLQTSQGRFSFLPPLNWVVKEEAATKEVVMMARNLITSIRFKIVEDALEATMEARVARWRQTMSENYPDGKITAEFPCYTSKVAGVALDFDRVAPNKTKIFTRLAFIPLSGGRVEFELTTTSGELTDPRLAFGNFLTSFRIESGTEK